jgi:hypothetical protein
MDTNLAQIVSLANATDTEISILKSTLKAANSTKVFSGLELTPWKLAAGALADSDTAKGNIPIAVQSQPLIECASFAIDPKGKAWADAYWYKELGADASKTRFTYEVSFLFPTPAYSLASQAIELDIQQVISGMVYNFGFQFDFAEGIFRTWNRGEHEAIGGGWNPTTMSLPRWSAGQWTRVAVQGHTLPGSVLYDSVTINNVKSTLNIHYPAAKLNLSDMLNCAVQLDGNASGTAYRVMVDVVSLRLE